MVSYAIIEHWYRLWLVACSVLSWTDLLSIGPLGTNYGEIRIQIFSSKKLHVKMWSAKGWTYCSGPNIFDDRYTLTRGEIQSNNERCNSPLHQCSISLGCHGDKENTMCCVCLSSLVDHFHIWLPLPSLGLGYDRQWLGLPKVIAVHWSYRNCKWKICVYYLKWKCLHFDKIFISGCTR